jgi:hypothetical protein
MKNESNLKSIISSLLLLLTPHSRAVVLFIYLFIYLFIFTSEQIKAEGKGCLVWLL